MNSNLTRPVISERERERQVFLGQLNAAKASFREHLNASFVDPNVRGHLERALAHVREACVALNKGEALTVAQLLQEMERAQRHAEKPASPPGSLVRILRV